MDVTYLFFTGKKDDEMDPMDPSAYSDAPRYVLTAPVRLFLSPHPNQLEGRYENECDLSPLNIFLRVDYTHIHSDAH